MKRGMPMKIELNLDLVDLGDNAYWDTIGNAVRDEIKSNVLGMVRKMLKEDTKRIARIVEKVYAEAVQSLDVSAIAKLAAEKMKK